MRPKPLDEQRLQPGPFLQSVQPDDLVYFCCNVGDADAQVVVLPVAPDGVRRVIVIDAGVEDKVSDLLQALAAQQVISFEDADDTTIALVVATHPHHDHVAGMAALVRTYGAHIGEFWEPGFFHTTASYANMMREVAALDHVVYTQPTSGLRRFFGPVALTVLSPSIQLRNRFDTYGVEINDSSISLRLEHPARAVADQAAIGGGQANWAARARSATLILGADAQTLSWSFVATDFPFLAASGTPNARAIGAATGNKDLLATDVLKVSHHASKHGINLELLERMKPAVTLISATANGPAYGFPHTVTQEIIREALDPVAGKLDPAGQVRPHADPEAGSLAVIARGTRRELWRFGDGARDPIDLARGMQWS
jgi:beta-lactamase superfamily II metal-dependent hydrolase